VTRLKTWFDWLFRSRTTGRITVAQFPNLALWIYLVTVAVRWLIPADTTGRTIVDWVGVASLAWWAVDEVIRGVNPWRRILGLVVGAFTVANAVGLLH
jgi:hypothetical protein